MPHCTMRRDRAHQGHRPPEVRPVLNAAGTKCFVHKRFRDSAAGLEHMANIGAMMNPLSEVCTITGDVCGTASAAVRAALDTAHVMIYARSGGLTGHMTAEATTPDKRAATTHRVMSGYTADGKPGTDALTDLPDIAERARNQ